MDFDMATTDMMNQQQLMHIISQLESALANLPSSPSTPTSPPQPPSLPVPLYHTAAAPDPPVLLPAPVAASPADGMAIRREAPLCSAAAAAAAAMRYQLQVVGVGVDEDAAERPRRRNVRVSSEPQSVAARLRRERVSQRMRALQRLVPGGARLDTASMLDEAIRYVKFLKSHVRSLEQAAAALHGAAATTGGVAAGDYLCSCPYLA